MEKIFQYTDDLALKPNYTRYDAVSLTVIPFFATLTFVFI